jgi:hypothetical protein
MPPAMSFVAGGPSFSIMRVFPVPENLGKMFWVIQRFCGRSKNSGISDVGHTEILWMFQKIWNHRCFGSYGDDSADVPENLE